MGYVIFGLVMLDGMSYKNFSSNLVSFLVKNMVKEKILARQNHYKEFKNF
jgi:hypothetical protein